MPLRRSVLFLSGSQDDDALRHTISTCGADLVVLDLEDTVAPPKKPEARKRIARLLQEDIWGRSDRGVRINAATTPYAHADIVDTLTLARCRVDTLVCSKVEHDWHVRWIDQQITLVAQRLGVQENIKLSLGIETAGALTDIDKLASASRRNESLGFAIGDLSISLGVRIAPFLKDRSLYPGDLYHFVRSRINLAAKTHGLLSMDGPWPIVNDHATLAEDARWGAMLGMDGKVALAVEQVRVIHEAYRPSDAEIAHAERMKALYEKSLAAGEGSGVVDGEFMDPVTVGLALATLERAAAPV